MIEAENEKERPHVTLLERYQQFEREFCSVAQLREDGTCFFLVKFVVDI